MVMVVISVDKPSALVDETLRIRVTGVSPVSLVTIVATIRERASFYSYATYRADNEGEVDVSTADALAGSYTGVEPMGLVWSMVQQPGEPAGRRLMKLDVTTPLVTTFSLYPGQIDGTKAIEKAFQLIYRLATVTCERWYMGEGVTRIPLQEGRLKGTLFLPAGSGPFPGTLDLFGTAGGRVEYRSALLASRGIAALALCYFIPDLVVDLEYFVSAIDVLLSQPKVTQSGVAVIGMSKGSDIAYLLSIVSPKVRASINISGSAWIFGMGHTFQGEDFPHNWRMTQACVQASEELKPGETLALGPATQTYADQTSLKCGFPIERSENAHFLIIHGDDDQCVPEEHPRAVIDRLKMNGRTNYTLAMYPDAGHLIEPPHGPLTRISFHKYFGVLCAWGGKPKPHAQAQEESWSRMLRFIHDRVPVINSEYEQVSKSNSKL